MVNAEIGGYYDRLSRWNAAARLIGYGGGRRTLTVHRHLADPRFNGRPTATRLHDVLAEHLPPIPGALALDAGCGMGGTMLDLAGRLGCRFVGITLSASQAGIARQAARTRHAEAVQVLVQSYDAPPPGPFDLIVAVESLAHSPDPERSVGALAGVLRPGGLFAIVDDMPAEGALSSPDFQTFKAGWQCPHLLSRPDYLRIFARLGMGIAVDRDLTPECRPRSAGGLRRLMWLNRAVARTVPSAGLRAVMDSHLGGLALERLTRELCVQYRLLVARRPPAIG